MGVGVDISIIHACILKLKSNIHQSNIITLHYTGNSLAWKGINIIININIITTKNYNNNKSLSHATLTHAAHYVTLQNTELAIYQETIQLPQIKIKFFEECTYNTNKYWPYLNDFLLDQEFFNLGSVAPGAQLRTFQKSGWHQKTWLPQLTKKMLGFQTS